MSESSKRKIIELHAEIERLKKYIHELEDANTPELTTLRQIKAAAKAWMNKGFGYAPTASVVFDIVNGRGPNGGVR